MASVKTNLILNGINTVTSLLFPLITFPYVTRVLMPEGFGLVNFQYSIINYIIMFTSLGIPLYAVKAVASVRDDLAARNRITVEIFLLSLVLSAVGYVIVAAMAAFVPEIHQNAALFFVLSSAIVFNAIGVDWFYRGVEEFRFITVRAIAVKTVTTAAIFVFVRDSSDVIAYGVILVGISVGNNLVNFVHLRKYLSLREVVKENLRVAAHLKPAFQVFMLNILTNIYVQLNAVMLGFMSGDAEVGYLVAATKVPLILISLITSIGVVLLPRCSNLVATGKMREFGEIISKSLNFTVGMSLPMTVGLIVMANAVIMVFCGGGFAEAVPAIAWSAPVVIFVSLTNVFGLQILYPVGKLKIVLWSAGVAAAVNVALNLILIPPYGATGAAAATMAAEMAVLLVQVIAGRKYFPVKLSQISLIHYVVATFVMIVPVAICIHFIERPLMQLIAGAAAGGIVYFGFLLLRRDSLAMMLLSLIHRKKATV